MNAPIANPDVMAGFSARTGSARCEVKLYSQGAIAGKGKERIYATCDKPARYVWQ